MAPSRDSDPPQSRIRLDAGRFYRIPDAEWTLYFASTILSTPGKRRVFLNGVLSSETGEGDTLVATKGGAGGRRNHIADYTLIFFQLAVTLTVKNQSIMTLLLYSWQTSCVPQWGAIK